MVWYSRGSCLALRSFGNWRYSSSRWRGCGYARPSVPLRVARRARRQPLSLSAPCLSRSRDLALAASLPLPLSPIQGCLPNRPRGSILLSQRGPTGLDANVSATRQAQLSEHQFSHERSLTVWWRCGQNGRSVSSSASRSGLERLLTMQVGADHSRVMFCGLCCPSLLCGYADLWNRAHLCEAASAYRFLRASSTSVLWISSGTVSS